MARSRLVKKSQMYETAHDHGFGNNVYLYSITGAFLGICKNEPDVIVAAILHKPEIAKLSYMMEQIPADRYKMMANQVSAAHEYYECRKTDIWWVKKTFKEMWVKEYMQFTYTKYQVIKIHDRYNRLVFDEKTHTFIQLHIIPSRHRITLTHVPFEKYSHISKYRKLNITLTLIDTAPFEFPRFICDTDERKERTGYIILPDTTRTQGVFMTTKVGAVIKKLEKKGLVFEKNQLYHTAVSIYENQSR